jgi:hypothetical protein
MSLSLSLIRLNQFRRGVTDPRRPCYCHVDKDHTCKEFELQSTRNIARYYEAVDCLDQAKKTLEPSKEDKKKTGVINLLSTSKQVKDAKAIIEWEDWFTEDDHYKNDLKPFCLYPADVKSLLKKPGAEILHLESPFKEVYPDLYEVREESNDEFFEVRRMQEAEQEELALAFRPQSSGSSEEFLGQSDYFREPQDRKYTFAQRAARSYNGEAKDEEESKE